MPKLIRTVDVNWQDFYSRQAFYFYPIFDEQYILSEIEINKATVNKTMGLKAGFPKIPAYDAEEFLWGAKSDDVLMRNMHQFQIAGALAACIYFT